MTVSGRPDGRTLRFAAMNDRPRTGALLPRLRRRPRRHGAGVAAATRCAGGAGRQSARPEAAALRAEGEGGHLPVHGRRAEPARTVRPQAEAAEAARPADPRVVRQGQALRVHGHVRQGAAEAAGHQAQVRPARQDAGPGCPSACRTSPRSSTTSPSSSRWRPTSSTTARRSCSSTPARRSSAGRAWARGSPTASAASRQDLPGFVVLQSGPRGPRGGAALLGERLPADDATRACRSAPAASRSSTSSVPPGVTRDRQKDVHRRRPRPEQPTASTRPAIRRSPRASRPTRWPTACRPAPRS